MSEFHDFLVTNRKDILAKTSISRQVLYSWLNDEYKPKYEHIIELLKEFPTFHITLYKEANDERCYHNC